MLPCTVECSGPASEFRKIRPQAPRVGRWAYLLQHNAVSVDNASRLVNLQGARIGRPGRIYVSLSSRAGVLEEVRVGGEAVVVGAGTVLY
jgi:predicted PhzF superfamily epimerase YddE/YHI9